MIVLVVLQNAYDRGALGRGWNPARWRSELLASRTGVRLRLALPEGARVHYTNASPVLGRGPDSSHAADPEHVRRVLRRVRPDVVLACGVSARQACAAAWTGHLVAIPHPASRVLTNELLAVARLKLTGIRFGRRKLLRQELQQHRGRVAEVVLA